MYLYICVFFYVSVVKWSNAVYRPFRRCTLVNSIPNIQFKAKYYNSINKLSIHWLIHTYTQSTGHTYFFNIMYNVSNTGTIAPQVNQQVTHHHHSHLINKLSINALRMTVDCGMVWLESPDQMSEYKSGLCRYKYISQYTMWNVHPVELSSLVGYLPWGSNALGRMLLDRLDLTGVWNLGDLDKKK